MPYKTNKNLPKSIRDNLPEEAQTIFRKVFNNSEKQYKDPKKRRGNVSLDEVCMKVAWAAVKREYEKKGDKWVKSRS